MVRKYSAFGFFEPRNLADPPYIFSFIDIWKHEKLRKYYKNDYKIVKLA